jgi:hypothetical protein
MATWGEFIAEFKVHNFKTAGIQGMYVKVDEVLDLFDERQKLRKQLAEQSYGAPPAAVSAESVAAEVAAERERCAKDVEEFAEACAAEPNQPEYVVTVLRYAAELIRSRSQAGAEAEPVAEAAPAAEPMDEDAAAALAAVEIPPAQVPTAEPVQSGDEHSS